ncbi:MAG: CDP-alcohol phosphatidyltransferase family protein [Lachnospiraceae bacterium]|jgi:cardiolipin synthase|nr:CDP-alcohol phosphatidyltransferase family protein [Lachnospiraceae bacterium]
MNRRELWTIPNILGYIRLLLIPVFAVLYLKEYYLGASIALAVSILSDFLDGIIARRFNQITELGKFLDPVADKLTQATIVVCLAFRYPLLWAIFAVEVLKEGFMLVAGAIMLKVKGRKLNGAKWYGKVTTAVMDFTLLFLLIFPHMPGSVRTGLILFCGACMGLTLALYIPEFCRMARSH